MTTSPFPHAGPLAAEDVTGRDDEVNALALRLRERQPVALLGPRRYGKTSLMRHVIWRLDQVEPLAAIWLDLFGVTSFSDFAVRLDRALGDVHGRLRQVVDSVAAGLSVRLGVIGMEVRRAASSGPDPIAATHQLLDVFVRSAARQPVVLVCDEFADIGRVDGLAAVLRTHLQHHYTDFGLVFAGSQPSMMRTLFADRGQPFFAQAELLELGPLSDDAVTAIIHDGFDRTNRSAGSVASRIVPIANGHPQRMMLLADAAWQLTPESAEATDETWENALIQVQARVDGELDGLYRELSASQGSVLRAIAHTGSAFAAAETRFHDLSSGSITSARDTLLRDGHLRRTEDRGVELVDPLFADWLRRTFP